MKNISTTILLSILLMAGCRGNRIENIPTVDPEPIFFEEFNASSQGGGEEPDSKVSLNEINRRSLIWDKDDTVAVFSNSADYLRYNVKRGFAGQSNTILQMSDALVNSSDGQTSGSLDCFYYKEDGEPTLLSAYIACYPYRIARSCQESEKGVFQLKIEIPSQQSINPGSFSRNFLPMVAVTENLADNSLPFKNIMGLIRLRLDGDLNISNIRIRGNAHEKLSGEAVINCSSRENPVLQMAGNASEEIVLNAPRGVLNLARSEVKDIYVVVPPADYTEGITIEYLIGGETFSYRHEAFNLHRGEIVTIAQNLSYEHICELFGGPAVCYIDDDFTGVNNDGKVIGNYKKVHDFFLSRGYAMDFALINSPEEPHMWIPEGKVNVIRKWRDEGFGFLYHPIHSQGWYDYAPSQPHNTKMLEESIRLAKKCFDFYGLGDPNILVWPGDSNKWPENVDIARKYFDCGIKASYIGSNHNAEVDRFQIQRTSLQAISATNTKTQIKEQIKSYLDNGDWVILGSHIYELVDTDVPDETTFSTANLFEMIDYINSLCPIRHTQEVWKERRIMWECKPAD